MLKKSLLALLFLVTPPLNAEVRVWRGTLTLPTYEEGLPDPNPPFDQFAANRFNYPYTMRNNISGRRVDHVWRAIYLENEYLKCSVLPDIGGHIYTCIDKISGKPMFYANPSIKKAAISNRGAWAAFGVEFNFPVAHSWVTISPVNFAFAKHDDGSASVTVGGIDRVYGMEWTVELILRPKSTVLEQRVTLNNRSDVRHRFYWWSNAGVEVWDDSRIAYPMRFAASHGFTEVQAWPVYEGTDFSILHNHTKGPVSLFVHGSRENFMGIWNPQTNTGTVHFADYAELPAKKIWSWGADADALDWRKALSDNNSAYMEVQAGLFRNQETYAFLEPRQTIRFSEYWMPAREIGGISQANLGGVGSLARRANSLIAGFNANQAIRQAEVTISNGTQQVLHEKVDLSPEHTWTHELQGADSQAKYTIEIRDARGSIVLRHTEGIYDWTPESEIKVGPQPSYQIPEPNKRTYDDWVQFGKNEELNGRILQALDTYRETLRRFPEGFSAQKSAGRVAVTLLRFEEAKDFLEPVHSRDTSDGEVSYYLGLAYDGIGDTRHAQASYEDASRMPAFQSAAALRLGELHARSGNLPIAERYLSEAVRTAPDDLRGREELIAIKDAAGKTQDARELAQETLARFPLSQFIPEKLGNPDPEHLTNDSYRVLSIAAQYIRLGLYQRAFIVVSRQYPAATADQAEPGVPAPSDHPMVAYFRGYCREKVGKSGAEDYMIASETSNCLCVSRLGRGVSRVAGRVACQSYGCHSPLSAGNTLILAWRDEFRSGRMGGSTEAESEYSRNGCEYRPCVAPRQPRARALLAAFQEGLHSDPTNVAVYMGMDQSLSILGRPASERVAALEKYPKLAESPPPLIFELILNLAGGWRF